MSRTRPAPANHLSRPELVVHLFAVADGVGGDAGRDYLRVVWQALGDQLAMTDEIPGLGIPVESGWEPRDARFVGVLAARMRTGSGVHQAVLRCEGDIWCLSFVLAPDPTEGATWLDLDSSCTRILGETPAGVIGVVRLYLAYRRSAASTSARPVLELLRDLAPADPAAPASWPEHGAHVPEGYTMWDVSTADDGGRERRLLVLGHAAHDRALSTWSWLGPGPDLPLPALARYLMHAAKLRYQLRIWRADRESFQVLGRRADAAVGDLLVATTMVSGNRAPEPTSPTNTRALDVLQVCELGLIDSLTRLREMRRTVEIAASNMDDIGTGAAEGLFANDRALADWFARQLEDDAVYVDGAVQRSNQIGALVDRMVERGLRRRQESVNVGLTGMLGAILMALSAIQAFQYTVRVPTQAKPALITLLGSFALLSSLIVLRVVVTRRSWSVVLVHIGIGSVVASLAWLLVAIVAGHRVGPVITSALAGASLLLGIIVSVCVTKLGQRRKTSAT